MTPAHDPRMQVGIEDRASPALVAVARAAVLVHMEAFLRTSPGPEELLEFCENYAGRAVADYIIRRGHEPAVEPAALSALQAMVLGALRGASMPRTSRRLGDELGEHPVTIAAALGELEARGLARILDPGDGTPRGANGQRRWIAVS